MSASVTISPSDVARLVAPGGSVNVAVRKAAVDTLSTAQILAPVNTGRLRSSGVIHSSSSVPGGWDVVFPVGYAVFVELGTRYMRARPFMREALRRVVG